MAISLASLRRSTSLTPPRLLTYGVAGVGKTFFATSAPRPVVIQTEDGLGTISASKPLHWAQMQAYMHLAGLDRAFLSTADEFSPEVAFENSPLGCGG